MVRLLLNGTVIEGLWTPPVCIQDTVGRLNYARGFYIPTSSVLVRKEVLHEVGGFDDNLSRAEDFVLVANFIE